VFQRLPFTAVGVLFWFLCYAGTYKVLSYIRGIDVFGELLSEKIFSLTFFSLLGFLLLSNVITALSSFYLATDIPFLLSKPIKTKDILRLKLFDTTVNSSWMIVSFIPPIFLAYGIHYQAPVSFYISIFISFSLFIFLTAGIGVSIAHILTRIFPAHRARSILIVTGFLMLIIVYFFMKSIVPQDVVLTENIIISIIGFSTDSLLFPSSWVTAVTFPLLSKSSPEYFYAVVLVINSMFFFILSEYLGTSLYRKNIERMQPSKGSGTVFWGNYFPERTAALFYKDIKIFFRDTGQWSQLFIIGALIMIYVYNFKSLPMRELSLLSPFAKELLVLINILMAGLVLSAVSARFLYSSVSLEGRAFWIIRTAPVDTGKFLWDKFKFGCLPVTVFMVTLVYLTNVFIDAGGALMWLSIVTVILLSISISGLGTGLGAIFPKYKYENIASVSLSLGGIAFMLIAFSVVIATLSLEAWAYYMYHVKSGLAQGLSYSDKILMMICLLLVLGINCATFYLPMRLGKINIEKNPCL
jgi:ABC-2 type transport system permease protein